MNSPNAVRSLNAGLAGVAAWVIPGVLGRLGIDLLMVPFAAFGALAGAVALYFAYAARKDFAEDPDFEGRKLAGIGITLGIALLAPLLIVASVLLDSRFKG